MPNNCPLCNSESIVFYENKKQIFHQCKNCYGIFLDENERLNRESEIIRYENHNNDVEDIKYQKFVSPITSAILRDYTTDDKGLDFGAGTGPVISKVLTDNNFWIVQYDPIFHNYPKLLNDKYDYIACCEVIEHFHNPLKEFDLLKRLLRKNGKLYCMTNIYYENINFDRWYYKNDATHVFIYQKNTFDWIKEKFNFSKVTIEDRLITFFD